MNGKVVVQEAYSSQPWRPGTPGADAGRRGIRIMASAWTSARPIAELYDETARAVLVAGRAALTVPERTALGAAAGRFPLLR